MQSNIFTVSTTYLFKFFCFIQTLRGRKRQARGHHSPCSIQGKWLAIDDQENNILASLCLASYLAANWLQSLKRNIVLTSYF